MPTPTPETETGNLMDAAELDALQRKAQRRMLTPEEARKLEALLRRSRTVPATYTLTLDELRRINAAGITGGFFTALRSVREAPALTDAAKALTDDDQLLEFACATMAANLSRPTQAEQTERFLRQVDDVLAADSTAAAAWAVKPHILEGLPDAAKDDAR